MSTNPFPGPQPYRAADRRRFYGREALAKKLANQILARAATTVFGPSGSGKSSLLQAGVIPGLQDSDDVRLVRIDAWPAAEAPLPWLVNTIAADLELRTQPQQQNHIERLQEVIDLAGRQSERPMLVYLDQFEQIFIATHDEKYMKDLLDGLTWLIRPKQNRELHLVLSLREDYLGRLRDWTRDKSELSAHGFRVGPLTVAEMVKAMCRTAGDGDPPQTWNPDEIRELMFDVRVPGQSRTEAAEIQAAFAQIVCRAVWEERTSGKMMDLRTANAEAILYRYLDTTLAELGPLHDAALKLLEQQLIDEEGHRTLLTEKEARLVLPAAQATEVLGQLEKAAILHAEEHQGSRYFELGHDWLAKKVFERRAERKKWEEEAAQAAQLLETRRQFRRKLAMISGVAVVMGALTLWALWARHDAKKAQKRAEESEQVATQQREKAEAAEHSARQASHRAQQALRMTIANGLMLTGKPDLAALVLQMVTEPQTMRGWHQSAINALKVRLPQRTVHVAEGESPYEWSHDGKRLLMTTADNAIRIIDPNGHAAPVTLRVDNHTLRWPYFSPDDRYVVVSTLDGPLFVWPSDGSGQPIQLDGATSAPLAVAWSHDGKRIATGSLDRMLRIWNADGSGTPISHAHDRMVTSITWSPNNAQVLVVEAGFDAIVRNADSEGRGTSVLEELASKEVDWSPDGRRIAGVAVKSSGPAPDDESADQSGLVMIAEPQKRTILPPIDLGRGRPTSVRWSPDGRRLVAAIGEFLTIVGTDGTTERVELRGHSGRVQGVSWRPDGTRIASSSLDKTVRVWNSSGKNPGLVLAGHTDSVIGSPRWSADGRQLRTIGQDKTARVWNVVGPEQPIVMEHQSDIRFGGFSNDGQRVLLSDVDGNCTAWNVDGSGKPSPLHTTREKSVITAWSPSGNTVARIVSSERVPNSATLSLWKADAVGTPSQTLAIDGQVGDMAWSPDGQRLAISLSPHTLRIFNVSEKMRTIDVSLGEFAGTFLKWSPDGKRIAVFDGSQALEVWNADGTGKPIVLVSHGFQPTAWMWSPDGSKFAAIALEKPLRVWRLDAPDNPTVFEAYPSGGYDISWSPDGSRIATANVDNTLRIWKAIGDDKPLVFRGHETGRIVMVRWSPDGQRVVTASDDKTARVWDLKNPGDVLVLDAHSGGVTRAEWSPDGKRILTISEDKTARVWLMDIALLQDALRASSSNCLTVEQRETLLLDDEATARSGYEACEKAAGRAP